MKRMGILLLVLLLSLHMLTAFAAAGEDSYIFDIYSVNKHGNVILDVYGNTFLELGFEYGDLITVQVNGRTLEMPVCSNYTDVDDGQYVCRVNTNEDISQSTVVLAIKNSSMAADTGILADADGKTPLSVTVTLKEKGAYLGEYLRRQLTRTNVRTDYPSLTDEEYANFRMVETSGIAPYALYRSSSPLNPALNRNREADEALNNAGIAAVLNLADTESQMREYESYPASYYADRAVICLGMPVDIRDGRFQDGLAAGLRFLIRNDGPYLIHCNEGRDRTGVVCAVLECLMGANLDEVIADYMKTYTLFYGVQPGEPKYELLAQANLLDALTAIFNGQDPASADLADCARQYLLTLGLSQDEIDAVRERLSERY